MNSIILHQSLDKSSNWLRTEIESVEDVRKLSFALIGLIDSGDEKYGHGIQRIAQKIISKQEKVDDEYFGSWNKELWDTSHAIIAINRSVIDSRVIIKNESVKNGLKYIKKQWNKTNLDNWSDYISETIACCKVIIEVGDVSQNDNVKLALRWLVGRKCKDGSFASIKYTAQIVSLLSLARDELFIYENDRHIESGVKFLRKQINDNSLKLFQEPWVISQIISALIDSKVTGMNKDIEKCCKSLLKIQKNSKSGESWFDSIVRTTSCMTAISKVLGSIELQKRTRNFWLRVNPQPARFTWTWNPRKNDNGEQIGQGIATVDASDDNHEIQKLVSIKQDQFNISLINDVSNQVNTASGISTRSIQQKRGKSKVKVKKNSKDNAFLEIKKTGEFLYKNILTIRGKDETFSSVLARSQIGHLSISTEGSESLQSIPWELIYDEDNFACLKYALGRSLGKNHKSNTKPIKNKKLKVLLVGDPTETLPGVDKELESLKNGLLEYETLISVDKIYGEEVTREIFFDTISNGNYDIIHFAGHAELLDGESFLIFKDEENDDGSFYKETVGAQDIANQIENCVIKPKIVFMNACSSAAKTNELDDEKLDYENSSNIALDFVSQLTSVNISAYVGAIWPIHDNEAANFAIDFYTNILKGCTIGDAVRIARIESYLDDPAELTWASFVLYGTPSTRIIDSTVELKSKDMSNDILIKSHKKTKSKYESREFIIKCEKVIELLSDPKFEFRKQKTLTKTSRMNNTEFKEFLHRYPQVKHSSINAADGSSLYRLVKSRYTF